MGFIVRYQFNGAAVGDPGRARSILEARQLALEGGTIHGADLAIILSVGRDGRETAVESKSL
jgi:hypothetical protein